MLKVLLLSLEDCIYVQTEEKGVTFDLNFVQRLLKQLGEQIGL